MNIRVLVMLIATGTVVMLDLTPVLAGHNSHRGVDSQITHREQPISARDFIDSLKTSIDGQPHWVDRTRLPQSVSRHDLIQLTADLLNQWKKEQRPVNLGWAWRNVHFRISAAVNIMFNQPSTDYVDILSEIVKTEGLQCRKMAAEAIGAASGDSEVLRELSKSADDQVRFWASQARNRVLHDPVDDLGSLPSHSLRLATLLVSCRTNRWSTRAPHYYSRDTAIVMAHEYPEQMTRFIQDHCSKTATKHYLADLGLSASSGDLDAPLLCPFCDFRKPIRICRTPPAGADDWSPELRHLVGQFIGWPNVEYGPERASVPPTIPYEAIERAAASELRQWKIDKEDCRQERLWILVTIMSGNPAHVFADFLSQIGATEGLWPEIRERAIIATGASGGFSELEELMESASPFVRSRARAAKMLALPQRERHSFCRELKQKAGGHTGFDVDAPEIPCLLSETLDGIPGRGKRRSSNHDERLMSLVDGAARNNLWSQTSESTWFPTAPYLLAILSVKNPEFFADLVRQRFGDDPFASMTLFVDYSLPSTTEERAAWKTKFGERVNWPPLRFPIAREVLEPNAPGDRRK